MSITHSTLRDDRGMVLAVVLMFLVILAAMGSAAVMMTRAEIQTGDNYKNSEQAFYIAQAGAEHAREELRALNAVSSDKGSYSDELANAAGLNGLLDGYFSGTDDIPLISSGSLAEGTYTVYLTNDSDDGLLNQTDTNRIVTLTSVATGPNGSKATVEITVAIFDIFAPPSPITLVGPGATFVGNESAAKSLYGNDKCGAGDSIGVTRPVVAFSNPADEVNIQTAINDFQPTTYHAWDESGNDVTADDPSNMHYIASTIDPTSINVIMTNYGVDLLDADDLNEVVKTIEKAADTVAPGGTSASSVYVGAPGDTQVVVIKGDFWLNDDGAGILVVTGDLRFDGFINYDGIIFVIGTGVMDRQGAGNGTISGGILVANTLGPDGIMYTGDDTLGTPIFDTAGGGASNVFYCSTAMQQALTDVPPRTIAFKHVM